MQYFINGFSNTVELHDFMSRAALFEFVVDVSEEGLVGGDVHVAPSRGG